MKSRSTRYFAGLFIGMAGLLLGQSIFGAVLTHRYSFDSDASDQIRSSAADGTLTGTASIANGSLVLDGKDQSCMLLPENLFTNYDAITFEMWYSDSGTNSRDCALFYFGSSLFTSYNLSATLSSVNPAPIGGTNHLVWTLDNDAQVRIYINGALASISKSTFTPLSLGPTAYNYIGGSKSGKLCFSGKVLEFRTYQGVLSPLDVALSDQLGPDRPLSDPGALKAVRLSPFSFGPGARVPASVLADFENVSNVNISTVPPLTLTSDNPSVLAVDPDNRLRTIALGTANVTATFQGLSDTQPVVVALQEGVSLIHRYSFGERANDWIVHDSVGTAHGRTVGGTAVFTGDGQLGLGIGFGDGSYVTLPSGLLSSQSEISIEAWITWTYRSSWPWQRVFDFGSSSNIYGGWGYNYFFLTTDAGVARMAITTNGNGDETYLDWTNRLPLNVPCHVAATYSSARGVAKFYVNGELADAATASIPLSAILDVSNYLGKSQFTQDTIYRGYYDEFRIYSGLLHDTDIANNYAAGPNTLPEPAPGPQISTFPVNASCYEATLNGAINPKGSPTIAYFRYGTNTDYTRETDRIDLGNGTSLSTFSKPIDGLMPQTTYHVQCVAISPTGTNYGADLAFVTADTVQTLDADPVGMQAARLNGLVSPGAFSTKVWFEWGTNYLSLDCTTPPVTLDAGFDSVPVNAELSGLKPNTYHYYRVVAESEAGTRYGKMPDFRTLPASAAKPSLSTRATPDQSTFGIRFTPQFGASYTLQRSTNLIDWFDLTNLNVFTNTQIELLDTNASALPSSFYRLRVP